MPPPLERTTIFLPFEAFKLVRGPRLVPGVPPLNAAAANATYQMSIILSKFLISADGAALEGFKEGRFRLKLFSVGTFAADEAPAKTIAVPSPMYAAAHGPSPCRTPRAIYPRRLLPRCHTLVWCPQQ